MRCAVDTQADVAEVEEVSAEEAGEIDGKREGTTAEAEAEAEVEVEKECHPSLRWRQCFVCCVAAVTVKRACSFVEMGKAEVAIFLTIPGAWTRHFKTFRKMIGSANNAVLLPAVQVSPRVVI